MKLEATKYVQTVERGYYVLCKLYRVAPYDLSVNTYLNTSNTSSIPRQTLLDTDTRTEMKSILIVYMISCSQTKS